MSCIRFDHNFNIINLFAEFFLRRQKLGLEDVEKDPWKSKLRDNTDRALKKIVTDLLCDKRTKLKKISNTVGEEHATVVRRSSSADN